MRAAHRGREVICVIDAGVGTELGHIVSEQARMIRRYTAGRNGNAQNRNYVNS
jgi:hypothetical protein